MNVQLITFEEVKDWSKERIQLEVGKYTNTLIDISSLSDEDAKRFVASILSLGQALNK